MNDNGFRGQRLGWGPWRRDWYSLCSTHGGSAHNHTDCIRCMAGEYVWRIPQAVSSFVYKHAPRLWRWWANRPGSRSRRFLQSAFPKLK